MIGAAVRLKGIVGLIVLAFTLAACAGTGHVINAGHGVNEGLRGEPVREVKAYGYITQISADAGVFSIKHGPIPEMNWAPMVMKFNATNEIDLTQFEPGEKVDFILELDADNNYQVKQINSVTP